MRWFQDSPLSFEIIQRHRPSEPTKTMLSLRTLPLNHSILHSKLHSEKDMFTGSSATQQPNHMSFTQAESTSHPPGPWCFVPFLHHVNFLLGLWTPLPGWLKTAILQEKQMLQCLDFTGIIWRICDDWWGSCYIHSLDHLQRVNFMFFLLEVQHRFVCSWKHPLICECWGRGAIHSGHWNIGIPSQDSISRQSLIITCSNLAVA